MIFIRKIKSTDTIEKEQLQLWQDFQIYQKIENSEKLKNYLVLKERVESKTFIENRREIESLRFNGSPEEKMQKEFAAYEKNSKLKVYFNLKSSIEFERFKKTEKSGAPKKLEELEKQVNSTSFKKALHDLSHPKKGDNAGSEELGKLNVLAVKQEYENLRSSDDIRFYYQFNKSKAFRIYNEIDGSSYLSSYDDLKIEIESDKYKERKDYLEDKKRYEKTEDFKALQDFQKLNDDSEIQLYLKYRKSNAFKFFRDWVPTFVEEFDNNFDKGKWSYITPIAEKGPGKNFSIKQQLHVANDDANFYVEDSILTLETKHHNIEGLYWDEKFGFVNKQFNYSSGIAHTLYQFKQEYGFFALKVKASKVKGVISSVSLVDNDEEPCIRLFTSNGNVIQGGLVKTDQMNKSLIPVKFSVPSKGYIIVALNWTPEKMEWFINERSAGVLSHSVPHSPLGLRIETEVIKDTGHLPHRLDIDWIRCYKRRK